MAAAHDRDARTTSPALFTPGPTTASADISAAIAQEMVPARTPAFMAVMADVAERLRGVFATRGDVLTLTAAGTGAMEAALVNLVAREDTVLVAHAGKFGERWCELTRAHGVRHHELTVPWGERITPRALARAMDDAGEVKVVFLTQSETSTGVVHDVEALARTVREHGDALVVVDAVSALAAVPLAMDDWGIDACVSAGHKGLMCPPGLAFVALGPRALERIEAPALPRHYFDLRLARGGLDVGGSPWTPAVSLVRGLQRSLIHLEGDGLAAAWARTARLARATRAAVDACGLETYGEGGAVLTAVCAPADIDARDLVKGLRRRGFEVAGGQGTIKRRVLRIAHLGAIGDEDLLALLDALEAELGAHGVAIRPGAARAAAAAELAQD